ncbi:hypothetical protein Tco_0737194 [Tanacetum coccineum]
MDMLSYTLNARPISKNDSQLDYDQQIQLPIVICCSPRVHTFTGQDTMVPSVALWHRQREAVDHYLFLPLSSVFCGIRSAVSIIFAKSKRIFQTDVSSSCQGLLIEATYSGSYIQHSRDVDLSLQVSDGVVFPLKLIL